jgi:hypothetical protein
MPRYAGTIPQIAQAYENDPRTRLAASMLASGGSTAPVAQGGWAVPDGLARAAQAIGGAYFGKKNEKKYASREQEYIEAMRAAAEAAQQPQPQAQPMPNPAANNPGTQAMGQAAAALAAPQPIQSFDPGPSTAPQAPPPQSLVPQQQPQQAMAQERPQQQLSARDYYYNGIVPISVRRLRVPSAPAK